MAARVPSAGFTQDFFFHITQFHRLAGCAQLMCERAVEPINRRTPTKTHHRFTLGVLGGLGLALAMSALLPVQMLAQAPADSVNERVEIQEKFLYAYADAIDSNDCMSFSNLFAQDGVYDVTVKAVGRDALLQASIARQKSDIGKIKTRHNMMNIVFDQLTARRAETRTYFLTWQKPGDQFPAIQLAGTYRDVIVKSDDGRWLFKERKAIDMSSAP